MSQTVIAFGYKKKRGKDSICNMVQDHLSVVAPELTVIKIGFADKLKDICYQLYGWAGLKRGIYYETHYAEKEIVLPQIGFTPRQIWIGVGNKLREFYGDTWIDFTLKGGLAADVVLIKDTGYWNEATAVERVGGHLYKLEREGPLDLDARETQLDTWTKWRGIIDNNGSLRDLHNHAKTISMEVFGK